MQKLQFILTVTAGLFYRSPSVPSKHSDPMAVEEELKDN